MSSYLINTRPRLYTIDFLRGLVLILMALDHTRDFFHSVPDPLNFSHTTATLFFTRWITHFCAPTFIFLSGMSAYLYASRPGRTLPQTATFLFARGLWLIFIAFTLVYAGWSFFLSPYTVLFEVFFVIGVSMVILSFLIYLPIWLIGMISFTVIALHNLLDTFSAVDFGTLAPLWMLLHEEGGFTLHHLHFFVIYPLIPWFAVMAAGYALAPILNLPEKMRRQIFFCIGCLCLLLFIVIRGTNRYGDLHPWIVQKNTLFTLMSFLNCTKYPPSLAYLLMTLGLVFLVLSFVSEKFTEYSIPQKIIVFGRAPFLFYMLHVPLVHFFSLLTIYFYGGNEMLRQVIITEHGIFNLPIVYAMWFLVLMLLYYPCLYLADIKSRNSHWALSYI
ncbi:MAG: DUF1624 domain-containing protein [Gammaproteobacteria bacterium]|nr:DUF1624 domain-containing protein [Gammaproteobacteria bacterium]